MSGGKISRYLSEGSVRNFHEEIQEILLSALPIRSQHRLVPEVRFNEPRSER